MKGKLLVAYIYVANGEIERNNLLAQAFIGDLWIPSKKELFSEELYSSHYLPATARLDSAFADAHELEDLRRSPMIGDVVTLESDEDEWEAHLITHTGYQKIEF